MRCWRAACTWRLPRTKQGSSPRPMARPRSKPPGARPVNPLPRWGAETNARATPASRLFGAGLAAAAVAIFALALLAFLELDREGRLHHDVIARLEAIDAGDTLRANLVE